LDANFVFPHLADGKRRDIGNNSDSFEVSGTDFRRLDPGLALRREDRDKREDGDHIHLEHQRRPSIENIE